MQYFVTNRSDEPQQIVDAKGKARTLAPGETVKLPLPDDAEEGVHFTFLLAETEN